MEDPSIAVVVLDTLRKDAFDEQFDWLPGRRFQRAWAPSHWTVPVHASLFAGAYPSELGVHAKSKTFDVPRPVLAERLRDAGYRTRAFSNNINVSPRNDFDRGFEEFDGGWRLTAVERGDDLFPWGEFAAESAGDSPLRYLRAMWACVRSDAPTLASLRWGATLKLHDLGLGPHGDDGARQTLSYLRDLEHGDAPEFLFVNLMEPHLPYAAPRAYRTTRVDRIDSLVATVDDPDPDPAAVRQAYDDCVRYLADVYRDIHAELAASYDYVVTLSDHGELFGEHGAWAHSFGLYPELTHVPLSIDGPDVDEWATAGTVSLLDVHATVLDLAGLEADGRGRSLLADPRERDHLVEYHGLDGHQRDVLRTAGFEAAAEEMDRELDGLATGDYYGYETLEGWAETGDPPSDVESRLAALRDDRDVRDVAESTDGVEGELQAQLQDLGYM